MNTSLEFVLLPGTFDDEPSGSELLNESASFLANLHFEMPVTLLVGGIHVLDDIELPIIKMACDAWFHLRRIKSTGASDMALAPGGSLRFELDGDDIGVTAILSDDRTGRTSYLELVEVWQGFTDRARSVLTERFPELTGHAQLGEWFKSGKLPDDW